MKRRVKSKGPLPYVVGGLALLIFGSFMGPFAIPIALATGLGTKKNCDEEMDSVAAKKAEETAKTWLKNRQPSETNFVYTVTTGSNGLLFNLPIGRKYHFFEEGK